MDGEENEIVLGQFEEIKYHDEKVLLKKDCNDENHRLVEYFLQKIRMFANQGLTQIHSSALSDDGKIKEGGQPLGRWEIWPQFCITPGWEMGDGWHYREPGGGRSPRNPKGDGRFCKNRSVSQWEMGDSDLCPSVYRGNATI